MVRSAFQKNEIHLTKILESSGLTDPPDFDTPMHVYQPKRDHIQPVPNPAIGIETLAAANVNFCVDMEGDITRVDIREWFLYKTSDGFKWFAGELERNIRRNSAYIVYNANAYGFFAQVTRIDGTGIVRVYASGDYIF